MTGLLSVYLDIRFYFARGPVHLQGLGWFLGIRICIFGVDLSFLLAVIILAALFINSSEVRAVKDSLLPPNLLPLNKISHISLIIDHTKISH